MRNYIILYGLILALLLSGCDTLFNNDSNNDQTSDLEKLTSVDMWIMDADDAGQYSRAGIPRTEDKLRINADGTAEIWGARGMWQEMTYTEEDSDTLAFTTTREAYGDDVAEFKGDYTVTDNSLEIRYYGTREDGTQWEAPRSFTAGSLSTPITYEEDFEGEDAQFFGGSDWKVISDGSNKVYAPYQVTGEYSLTDLNLIAGEDFTCKLRFKLIESGTENDAPWFTFKLFHNSVTDFTYQYHTSLGIGSFTTASVYYANEAGDELLKKTVPVEALQWDTWYDLEIRVLDSTQYQFFLNDTLIATIDSEQPPIQSIGFEAHANDKIFYIDDVSVTYPKEPETAALDLTQFDLFFHESVYDSGRTDVLCAADLSEKTITSVFRTDLSMCSVRPIPGTKKVAVTGEASDGNIDVYTVDIDGDNLTQLTEDVNRDEYAFPTPDGQKLIFVSNRNASSGEDGRGDNIYDIFSMDVNGKNLQNLTDTTNSYEFYPVVSPGGEKIAYVYHGSDTDLADQIWIMDLDGSDPVQLTPEDWNNGFEAEIKSLSWNPNGSDIVFDMNEEPRYDTGESGIWKVSADTSTAPNTPTEILSPNSTTQYRDVAYSPDGSKILYHVEEILYVMNSDGTDNEIVRDVSSDERWVWDATWNTINSNGEFE